MLPTSVTVTASIAPTNISCHNILLTLVASVELLGLQSYTPSSHYMLLPLGSHQSDVRLSLNVLVHQATLGCRDVARVIRYLAVLSVP